MKLFLKMGLAAWVALFAFASAPTYAQIAQPNFAPRVLQTQTTAHFRKVVNFNDVVAGYPGCRDRLDSSWEHTSVTPRPGGNRANV